MANLGRWEGRAGRRKIALFDLDGTLADSRQPASAHVMDTLQELRKHVVVGIVSGSDESKVREQFGKNAHQLVDYLFVENGTVAFRDGSLLEQQDLTMAVGAGKLNKLINFSLKMLSEIELPVKKGTFIEFRTAVLNISPVGRSCSYAERIAFTETDRRHGIRQKMIERLYAEFPQSEFGMVFALGGQISVDCFPLGWDKTYCLGLLEKYDEPYEEVHFFGDRTEPGGNDHEIFGDKRTLGHAVTRPSDTVAKLRDIFGVSVPLVGSSEN